VPSQVPPPSGVHPRPSAEGESRRTRGTPVHHPAICPTEERRRKLQ